MNESGPCPQCGQLRLAEAPEDLCRPCQGQIDEGGRGLRILREVETATAASAGSARWPGGPRVLDELAHAIDPGDAVRLRTIDDEPDLPARPFSEASEAGRYQLFGEVSRGADTVVLRALDGDLGRDLDMKVLLGPHRQQPGRVRRFVREAQILSQLRHPGVPSVYELGVFPDRRPYLAMTVLAGRPLSEVLAGCDDLALHRPALLRVFEQVSQTLAYAHARGVRHRSLDASGVVVGPFGEVQLSDWGSAEVAAEDAEPARPVDASDDVFRLGSLLTELLTGAPAVFGEQAAAAARLDRPDIDPDLRALARACLSPDPSRRPRDPEVVFQAVTGYHASLPLRVRESEAASASASAEARSAREQAERQRRLRWKTGAAAAAGVFLLGLPLVVFRPASADPKPVAARGIEPLDVGPRPSPEPAVLDRTVVAAASPSPASPESPAPAPAPPAAEKAKSDGAVVEVAAEVAVAPVPDRVLADSLAAAFDLSGDDPDGSLRDRACAAAFSAAGVEPRSLSPTAFASRCKGRPEGAVQIAAFLDDWAEVRRTRADRDGARFLTEAAVALDPDPDRVGVRAALLKADPGESLAGLVVPAECPASTAALLGRSLASSGQPEKATAVIAGAVARAPDDARLNRSLAEALARSGRAGDAVRFDTAARALSPGTGHALAHRLERLGQTDAAVSVFRDLARLHPDDGRPLLCLGMALSQAGRAGEAASACESAVAVGRKRAGLYPDRPGARQDFGLALLAARQIDPALVELRQALRLDPSSARAHCDLGSALEASGQRDAALAEYEEAVRVNPTYADAHRRLGQALADAGRIPDAVVALRTAAGLSAEPATFDALGDALASNRQPVEAASAYRESVGLEPGRADTHNRLGVLLFDQSHDAAGAVDEFRAAVRLKPDLAQAHFNLGNALKTLGKRAEALAATREAIRLRPGYAEAHVNLGLILKADGRLDDAVASYRTAVRLKPDLAEAHQCLGNALTTLGDLTGAADAYSEALRLRPDDATARRSLESVLKQQTANAPPVKPG